MGKEKLLNTLFLLSIALIPVKLSLTYVSLIPLIIVWSCTVGKERIIQLAQSRVITPFLYFIVFSLISSFFGLHPLHSMVDLLRFAFYGSFLLVTSDLVIKHGITKPLVVLLASQTFTSLYSLIQSAFNWQLPQFFLGPVTQSGQLSMICVAAVGILLQTHAIFQNSSRNKIDFNPRFNKKILLIISFILLSALLFNLKRGPWMGVFFSLLILFGCHARKFIFPFILVSVLSVLSFSEIYYRLADSLQHFFIHGGRNEIWQIGLDFITRYPLGIGYGNSPILRNFSDSIPPELRHFHSNILNILVETGWIGCSAYIWWLYEIFSTMFRFSEKTPDIILIRSLVLALLSCQIAGIVEYNIGDSEVMLVNYLICGILSALLINKKSTS